MNPFVSLALESSLKMEGSAWRTPCTHCLHAYASLHGLSALKGSMNRTSFTPGGRRGGTGAVRGLGGVARVRGAPGSLEEAEASMEMDRAGVVTSVQLVWISLLHMCTGRCLR